MLYNLKHVHFWEANGEDENYYYVKCACGATDKRPK